mmetsp:Transcript_43479/g.98278  ORF Transcript_43479/g.98278 Transcript_43479/m.98278 type:complete len:214 (-) Transcript_43479:472-1113(-)
MSFQLVSALFVEAAKPAVKVVPTVPPPAPVWPLLAGFALLAATAGALAKRQSLSGTAISCLGAAASFATLEALDAGLFKPMGFGCVSGPHAAVAVILFATPPKNAKATAYSVLGGHLIAAIAALLQLAVLPAAVAFAAKTVIVSLVVLGMKLADAVHPPACAFAMLFVVGKQGPMDVIGPLIGCGILVACQQVWLKLPAAASPADKITDKKAQ